MEAPCNTNARASDVADTELMLERFRPLIEQALAQSDEGFTFEDVADDIRAGRAMLWVGENSVAVTRLRQFSAMHVWLASGDLEDVRHMAVQAEAKAREIGCDAIMGGGRQGWFKAMQPLGWAPYVMKELG